MKDMFEAAFWRAHLRGLLPEICAPLNMSDVK